MRKSILLAAAASAMMLAACSSEDSIAENSKGQEGASEVEIKLSAGASFSVETSRAAFMGDNGGEISDIDELGIFCLAKAQMDINHTPNSVNWFDDLTNWSGCIMDNVSARKDQNNIKWNKAGDHYFYPITQFYAYDFYAYYPYKAKSELNYEYNKISTEYDIDGTQDLIWGRATSAEEYAYSAKYFRKNGVNASTTPSVSLNHLLTRLWFVAIPGESYPGSGDYEMASHMSIDTLQIINGVSKVNVVIADHENLDMTLAERIVPLEYDTLTLTSTDAQGKPIKLIPAHLDDNPLHEQRVGDCLMLYPDTKYTIRLTMRMDAFTDAYDVYHKAEKFYSEVPLQLYANSADDSALFEQGKSYKIKLNVYGPKEIGLTATLVPWDEIDDPEHRIEL